MLRSVRTLVMAAIGALLLSGCKEVVHSDLHEREANEIVAVLYSQGISSSKEPLKDGLYSVSVPTAEFGAALAMLSSAGLPRESFSSLGEVFPNDSVVGTPFEERARFSFALSQELSRTLTEIEGVQFARVHIVIPEKGRFEDQAPPSKASIAIYHKDDFDPALNVPQMKKLVAYAVPNLAYDDVSVSLFPAGGVTDIVIEPMMPPSAANAAQAATFVSSALSGNYIAAQLLVLVFALIALSFLLRGVTGLWRTFGRFFSHAQ